MGITLLLALPMTAMGAGTAQNVDASTVAASVAAPAITPLNDNDCHAMLVANVISERNPLPCSRLTRVRFSYIDFEGHRKQDGEMIVMDAVAPYVQRLMAQLLAARFPLHGARGLGYYHGDDMASMADNNSSAFNGRPITGGGGWSKHAYGVAIDVNPLQNPYVSHDAGGRMTVLPPAAATMYTDRAAIRAGMAETVRTIFADNGFLIWGGSWHEPVDYQHFEIGERGFIEKLAHAKPEQAARMFEGYVRTYRNCVALRTPTGREAQCAQKTMRSVD